jgi:hypothetical protein
MCDVKSVLAYLTLILKLQIVCGYVIPMSNQRETLWVCLFSEIGILLFMPIVRDYVSELRPPAGL